MGGPLVARFARKAAEVAESKPLKKPPPQNFLIHDGCGGTFIFLKDPDRNPKIDDERICSQCHLKETYELDTLIIIAKPGISEREFIEVLIGLYKRIMGVDKIQEGTISQIIKILHDKSNPRVLAAEIVDPDAGKYRDTEILRLKSDNSEKYHRVVSTVCRKLKQEKLQE